MLGLKLQHAILKCDNHSAFKLAFNLVFHARSKHIKLDYHFIREKVKRKEVILEFVASTKQLANMFTKGLFEVQHKWITNNLSIFHKTNCLSGGVKNSLL